MSLLPSLLLVLITAIEAEEDYRLPGAWVPEYLGTWVQAGWVPEVLSELKVLDLCLVSPQDFPLNLKVK